MIILQTCPSYDHRSSYNTPIYHRLAHPTIIVFYNLVCAMFSYRIFSIILNAPSLSCQKSQILNPRISSLTSIFCYRLDVKITMHTMRRSNNDLVNGLINGRFFVIDAPMTFLLCIILQLLFFSHNLQFYNQCSSKCVHSMA